MPIFFYAPPAYHHGALAKQRADLTREMLQRANIEEATCVLDVGCGAGQTLRVVEDLNPTALLVGLEPDESACTLGRTLSERIHFLKGEGERLPLADGSVSHAVSCVAINYMNQAGAVRELTRVMAPGGKLVLSFIGFGYTLRDALFPRKKGFRQRLGNIKDFVMGLVLQIVGFQGKRSTFWGRTTPHTSVAWLRCRLREQGCAITWLGSEGRFLCWPATWWAIITKPCACGTPNK
jgi:SAM-dependent methyltransferase